MRVYHGTSINAAKNIRRIGFRVGTWFAFTHATARRYGPVVLEAEINPLLLSGDVTDQFHTLVPLIIAADWKGPDHA